MCNTVEVVHQKPVDFSFGGVLGTPQGSTGAISGAACKGPCGANVPNPIDLAVVADRTGSMGGAIADLEVAVESLLEFLTPSQHRVALGTIGRSAPGNSAPAGCKSQPSGNRASGRGSPSAFSDDYDDRRDTAERSRRAVVVEHAGDGGRLHRDRQLEHRHLPRGADAGRAGAADRDLPAVSVRDPLGPRPSPVKKAVMFMTDGEPNEGGATPATPIPSRPTAPSPATTRSRRRPPPRRTTSWS